jgi:hypothetical protein
MDVADSARKHGVRDEDIAHAFRNPMRRIQQNDRYLIIGADRAGRLLELIVLEPEDDEPLVIHAMPLRPKFYPHLAR